MATVVPDDMTIDVSSSEEEPEDEGDELANMVVDPAIRARSGHGHDIVKLRQGFGCRACKLTGASTSLFQF